MSNLLNRFTSLFRFFQDWFFPNACICCLKVSDSGIICAKCFQKITFIDAPYCRKCGKMFTVGVLHEILCTSCLIENRNFDVARSLFVYNQYIRQIIVRVKKIGDRNLIRKCCYMLMARYGNLLQGIDAIVPVPSHWSRVLIRGFNPADAIAWELSQLINIPVCRKLKRVSKTKYQHKIQKSERIKNVNGAFIFSGLPINNVLLVDDVLTTGATLNECAKTLRSAGTKRISCLTLASTGAK